MGEIKIQTSQHTVIEHQAASVAERILAQLVDYLIFTVYIIFMFIFGAISRNTNYTLWMAVSLPILLYHLFCEILMDGQSWGKRAMNIKVVKMDGSQPSGIDYFIRWAFRLIDITLSGGSIATLTIILNGKGQRLGDLAANTAIIRLKEKKRLNKAVFVNLPENYSPLYTNVADLETKDIYTIKEVIDYFNSYENVQLASKMAHNAKNAIEKKLNIKSELKPIEFLTWIIYDYNYYYRE